MTGEFLLEVQQLKARAQDVYEMQFLCGDMSHRISDYIRTNYNVLLDLQSISKFICCLFVSTDAHTAESVLQ